jgi:hypothetical protein
MKKSRTLFGALGLAVLLGFSTTTDGQSATCDPGQINTPCSSAKLVITPGETSTPPAGALGQTDTPPMDEVSLTEIASSVLLSMLSLF